MPVQLLRVGRPPLVPLPRGLRLQVVHAQDVAEAYTAAAVLGQPGAFNICADDLLDVAALSRLLGRGRALELPVPAVRAALAAGHRTGLVAADAGWLDMGMNAPVMDSSRAQRLLGWQPRHSAAETLAELLEGMAEGRGADSVPMRPRDSRRARVAGARRTAGREAARGPRSPRGSTRRCSGCTCPITSPARPRAPPGWTGWRRTSRTRPCTRRCPRWRSRSAPSDASSSS